MTDVDDWSDPHPGRPQEEPDYDAEADQEYWEHRDEVHAGRPCDCPVPTEAETEAAWKGRLETHEAADHGGKPCNCEAPF